MVILGGWVSFVVPKKTYVIEVVCIHWEHLVFHGDHECVQLCFRNWGIRVGKQRY